MPAFDNRQTPNVVLGSTMHSNRLKMIDNILLINKLNVRQRRIWLVKKAGENAVSSSEFMPFIPNDVNLEFLKQVFLSDKVTKKLENISSGTSNSQKRITPLDMLDYLLEKPEDVQEQVKIGTLFAHLDTLITVNQRKVDLLKRKKAGYLQKLFPKNGQNNPELRFKGYTDAWEKRKLNEIAKFNPKSTLPDVFEYVDLESVVGTKMINHRTETKTNAPSRAQRVAKFGDVFYQTVRPYQKNNYLFKINGVKYVFSTGYAQLRPKYSSEFLLARIQENMFVRKVLDRSTGTSYPAINSNDLAKIEITIPNSAEQENIGMLFLTLDNLIAVNQRTTIPIFPNQNSTLSLRFHPPSALN